MCAPGWTVFEKKRFLPPTMIRPPIIQPVASHCTDCAFRFLCVTTCAVNHLRKNATWRKLYHLCSSHTFIGCPTLNTLAQTSIPARRSRSYWQRDTAAPYYIATAHSAQRWSPQSTGFLPEQEYSLFISDRWNLVHVLPFFILISTFSCLTQNNCWRLRPAMRLLSPRSSRTQWRSNKTDASIKVCVTFFSTNDILIAHVTWFVISF